MQHIEVTISVHVILNVISVPLSGNISHMSNILHYIEKYFI